jgi:hypothetical protein
MRVCGIVTESESKGWTFLTPFLPACHFYEAHQSHAIGAESDKIIAAVESLNMRSDVVAKALLSIWELPKRLVATLTRTPASTAATRFGFHSFTVLRRDNHELSLGLVGRFWRADFGLRSIKDGDDFEHHWNPRDAKLVLRFRVMEAPQGGHALQTETFVYCPSRSTMSMFTPYWLAIRLASGWIRRRTLNAIEKSFAEKC